MKRAALSCRQLGLEYGISRTFIAEIVKRGELPGIRRGRTILVLREDFERWFRSHALRKTSSAEDVAARRLAAEGGR